MQTDIFLNLFLFLHVFVWNFVALFKIFYTQNNVY